ncbi:M48 family metallopeptidase [Undibacter mobilis]|uniref:M48 family metallopeptidase n=1 Tax=Undibacter mobilis TaxID=2292256 RepID=UPI00143D8916|nr:M48 family metallopeptidase [Undibacter mobilis]
MRQARPVSVAVMTVWASGFLTSCAAPVAQLPDMAKDVVAAEQRAQQIAQLRRYYSERHRMDAVAFRIRTANVAACKDRIAAQIGLTAATPRSLPRRYQSYASEALSIGWSRPTAISVVEGSPAAQAGLVAGDELTALNGDLIPLWGTANWMWRKIAENGTDPVRLDVRRDGVDRTVTVTPVMGCSIPVEYHIDETVNASASDLKILITSGILALTQSDAELALVIGHELAHSTLGHLDKQRWNTIVGAAAGAAIDVGILAGGVSTGGAFRKQFGGLGAMAYSVGFEREADYVGAYYAARAGYDTKGTEEIWRRMAFVQPQSILSGRTHPIMAVRFVQIQKTTAEIEDKKRRGRPLEPELKSADADPAPAVEAAARH